MDDTSDSEFRWQLEAAPLADSDDTSWARVEGGGLRQPAYVRVGLVEGELAVIGVLINNSERISGTDLRLPLTRILADFDAELFDAEPDLSKESIFDHQIVLADWATYNQAMWELLPTGTLSEPRGRGAAPPTSKQLQAFAAVYVEELGKAQRGAVTRAAKRFGMHRVTAHKWIQRCREAGILKVEGES